MHDEFWQEAALRICSICEDVHEMEFVGEESEKENPPSRENGMTAKIG